jgi:hypothetical protein
MSDRKYYCSYDNGECKTQYQYKSIINSNCDESHSKKKSKCKSKCKYYNCTEQKSQCLYQDLYTFDRNFYIKDRIIETCEVCYKSKKKNINSTDTCKCIYQDVKEYPLNGTKARYIKKFEIQLPTCATLDIIC